MSRKTPLALIAAAVLLVVAMAGSATAAALITGKDVKNGSLTGKDLKNGSVGATDVKNNLTGSDLKDGSVAEADLAGGVSAKLNAPNVAGYEIVTATQLVESDSEGTAYVACTAGKRAVGGGGDFEDDITSAIRGTTPARAIRGDSILFADATATFADAWAVTGYNGAIELRQLTAYVICVDPS
jgi:hypothetical protein